VIVVCQELATTVREIREDVPTVLIENAPGAGESAATGDGARVRASLGLSPDTPVVLYTGTFEPYQGLDLLYGAMKLVLAAKPAVRLVLVGGDPAQVESARRQIATTGITAAVVLTGQRPPGEIPSYLDAATVLVSPRSSGTNTPLKIYQYLRSGRPIVATNLRTHTQVLSADTAFLAEPTPAMFAEALLTALEDRERARRVGDAARRLAETEYSDAAYLAKTKEAFGLLGARASREAERGVA
jgi:glycosyltransferase involved in cell wall biosynthesis